MKRKILILMGSLLLMCFTSTLINGAENDCAYCYHQGDWVDYAWERLGSECYAGNDFCGTTTYCAAGSMLCHPMLCGNIDPTYNCHELYPN